MILSFVSQLLAAVTGREPSGTENVLRGFLIFGKKVQVGRYVEFVGRRNIRVGDKVGFYGNNYLNANGQQGNITIGDHTHVDRNAVLYGQGGLRIGSGCSIGCGTVIYTQSNQYLANPKLPFLEQPVMYAPVNIGNDVWVGGGSIILPGVTVGDHAVIGAGAVVTRNVESGSVVAGIPAKEIKRREIPVSN